MHIRSELPSDVDRIRAVLVESFPTPVEAQLVDLMRASGALSLSLVATDDDTDEVWGHVAFSPVTVAGLSADKVSAYGLAPVAVGSAHRERGVAAALIRAGLERCTERGAGFVVVLGDPAYYGRFGFRAARHWSLGDEYGGGDAFQALELRAGAIPARGGLVQYAPEFAVAAGDGSH